MKSFVLCLSTLLLVSLNVHAQDAAPTYKFSIGEPEQKQKSASKSGSKEEEYTAVSTFYGYPRFEYGLGYNPSYIGFKQSRGGVQYNIAGFNYLTVDGYATIQFRPENAIRLSAGFMQLKTDAISFGTAGNLKASEANIVKLEVAFDHCLFFDTFYHRMCFGPQFGVDGFPVLDFVGSTDLRMTQLRDMMAGLHVDYYYPVNKNFVSKTSFSYDYGMTQGQNETLFLTSDSKMSLASTVEWPHKDNAFWHFGVAVDSRSAKSNNNQSDGWKTEMLSYTILAGYKWMTGPASGEY